LLKPAARERPAWFSSFEKRHIDSVEAAAVFSGCGRYRYRLDISLQTGSGNNGKTVCAILQNPSVASTEIADKSIQFLEKLIFTKGLEPFDDGGKLMVMISQASVKAYARNRFGQPWQLLGKEPP
jgi:hypothetical protein